MPKFNLVTNATACLVLLALGTFFAVGWLLGGFDAERGAISSIAYLVAALFAERAGNDLREVR